MHSRRSRLRKALKADITNKILDKGRAWSHWPPRHSKLAIKYIRDSRGRQWGPRE